MRNLTEKDYKVLSKLYDKKANRGTSKINGYTRKELQERANISYTKAGDALKLLYEMDFVSLGIAKGREKTYFITVEGIQELQSIVQESLIAIKKEKENNKELDD